MVVDWLADRLIFLIPIVLSLSVHEWAHAWTALQLGDDTAARQGRMTLDPLAHIDPIGTLLLPLLGVPFGWAKPVPVNPLRFRRDVSLRLGLALTAVAGPISNLVLALGCALAIVALAWIAPSWARHGTIAREILETGVFLNGVLALFNLLPLHPLDGSRVVDGLISESLRPRWQAFSRWGVVILAVLIAAPFLFVGASLFRQPIDWILALLEGFLGFFGLS